MVWYVARKRVTRNATIIYSENAKDKGHLGDLGVNIHLKEMGCGNVGWWGRRTISSILQIQRWNLQVNN